MTALDQFLLVVDVFCRARCVSEARASTLIFNQGRRLSDIRAGGDVGTRRLVEALQWLSDNWPEGAEWPEGVTRPQQHPEPAQ